MNALSLTRKTERFPTFFEDFFNVPIPDWFNGGFGRKMQVPAVNIVENKNEYSISLAAPGLKKEDFKIDLDDNVLAISSEKEEKKEEKDEKYTRQEYSFSSFRRSFTIPDEVDTGKIDAQYVDGVLTLALPKKDEAKKAAVSKQIKIK